MLMAKGIEVGLARFATCPPNVPESLCVLSNVTIIMAPVFIGGRYMKLSRDISNSPFVIDGKKMTEDSVAELIGETIIHTDWFGGDGCVQWKKVLLPSLTE